MKMFVDFIVLFITVISPYTVPVYSQRFSFQPTFMVAPGIERGIFRFNRFLFPVGVPLLLPARLSTDTTNLGGRNSDLLSEASNVHTNAILFPADSNVGVPLLGLNNDAKCKITDGLIYYNGVCSRLLASCDDNINNWLIVNQNGQPNCLARPCLQGMLLFRGRCILSTEPRACGISEILYVEFTGVSHCDCEPDFIFDKGIGRCIAEHRQGSCPQGQIRELKGREITCVANNCPNDNLVINPEDNLCYTKTFVGACLKTKGLSLRFNSNNNTAMCVSASTRNILEVPALTSCPAGSKRDPTGRCQAVFRTDSPLSLRVPTQYVSRYAVCPPSYSRLPNGTCRKNNPLLSG